MGVVPVRIELEHVIRSLTAITMAFNEVAEIIGLAGEEKRFLERVDLER